MCLWFYRDIVNECDFGDASGAGWKLAGDGDVIDGIPTRNESLVAFGREDHLGNDQGVVRGERLFTIEKVLAVEVDRDVGNVVVDKVLNDHDIGENGPLSIAGANEASIEFDVDGEFVLGGSAVLNRVEAESEEGSKAAREQHQEQAAS